MLILVVPDFTSDCFKAPIPRTGLGLIMICQPIKIGKAV